MSENNADVFSSPNSRKTWRADSYPTGEQYLEWLRLLTPGHQAEHLGMVIEQAERGAWCQACSHSQRLSEAIARANHFETEYENAVQRLAAVEALEQKLRNEGRVRAATDLRKALTTDDGAREEVSMSGWTHDEAKRHTLIERLLERCATYGPGTCPSRGLDYDDWCERCLAADALTTDQEASA